MNEELLGVRGVSGIFVDDNSCRELESNCDFFVLN